MDDYRTDYLSVIFAPGGLREVVDNTVAVIQLAAQNVDALVGTGHSGVIPAAIVADRLGLGLTIIRKPGDPSHHQCNRNHQYLEGVVPRRYYIIDDFVSTGATIKRVLRCMQKEVPDAACAGLILYNWAHWNTNFNYQYNTHYVSERLPEIPLLLISSCIKPIAGADQRQPLYFNPGYKSLPASPKETPDGA